MKWAVTLVFLLTVMATVDEVPVDELKTSDEYIVDKCAEWDVFHVRYVEDKNRIDRLVDRFVATVTRLAGGGGLYPRPPFDL